MDNICCRMHTYSSSVTKSKISYAVPTWMTTCERNIKNVKCQFLVIAFRSSELYHHVHSRILIWYCLNLCTFLPTYKENVLKTGYLFRSCLFTRDLYMAVVIIVIPNMMRSIPNQKYQKFCNISNPIRNWTLTFSDISDDIFGWWTLGYINPFMHIPITYIMAIIVTTYMKWFL